MLLMKSETMQRAKEKLDKIVMDCYATIPVTVPFAVSFAAGFAATYCDLPVPASIALAAAPVPAIVGLNAYSLSKPSGSYVPAVLAIVSTASTVAGEGVGLLAGYIAKNYDIVPK